MATGVQQLQRGGTAAEWSTANPVLANRELGVTTDTGIIKIGDGVNAWDDLPVAFDGRFLPIGGTAANSELLQGISADNFISYLDVDDDPTAGKVAQRTGSGSLKVGSAAADDEAVTRLQMTTAIGKSTVGQVLSDATTTVNLALTDVGKTLFAANSSTTVQRLIFIATNATIAFPIGSWIDICSTSTGNLKIAPAGGVTVRGNVNVFGNHSLVRLVKTDTNQWDVLHLSNRPPGRFPRIRAIRTGSTSYVDGSYIFVPYDSIDAARTFNPDNEWFSLPAAGLPTGRRIIINKDGEYEIECNFISSVGAGTSSYTTINLMTADNSHVGERILAMMPTDICCHGFVRIRLNAGHSIGVANSTVGSGGDVADGGFGGYRNDLIITRVGD